MKEVTLGLLVCIKWEATLTYYFFIGVAGAWAGEWPSLLKCNMTCPARPLAGRRRGQCNQEAGQLFLETCCLQIRIAVKVTTYLWEGLWTAQLSLSGTTKGLWNSKRLPLNSSGTGMCVQHGREQYSGPSLSPASGRGSSLWDFPYRLVRTQHRTHVDVQMYPFWPAVVLCYFLAPLYPPSSSTWHWWEQKWRVN